MKFKLTEFQGPPSSMSMIHKPTKGHSSLSICKKNFFEYAKHCIFQVSNYIANSYGFTVYKWYLSLLLPLLSVAQFEYTNCIFDKREFAMFHICIVLYINKLYLPVNISDYLWLTLLWILIELDVCPTKWDTYFKPWLNL